ncbi:MAG: glycosyltransferase [Nitrososphaeria archaeon]
MSSQISVVICVKNRKNDIERTLRSIKKQIGIQEIIVVDGVSTDGTLEIAKKYTNKIYSDKGKGLGFARQLGAEMAKGKYVAFIDSDTYLPKNTLLIDMVNEMEKNNWVAIHARLIDPRSNKTLWEKCQDIYYRKVTFSRYGEANFLGTIVCVIRKDIILKYQFDPFMKHAMEDLDFWFRVRRYHKFGVSREIAYHYHRSTLKDFLNQMIWYGKGGAMFAYKHRAWKWLFYPLARIYFGLFIVIRYKCVDCIPYHLIRSIATLYGTILGLIELKKSLKINKQR